MILDRLLNPQRVAVIGVSTTNDNHPANVIFKKLQFRYPVVVYAVNNRGGELHGATVYPGVEALPEAVDLAIIAVRASSTPKILEDCIEKGIGGAIVVSGGFAEIGDQDLQDRLVAIAREANFHLLGRIVSVFFLLARSIPSSFPANAWKRRAPEAWRS